jgi:hypothetical protein
VKIKSHLIALLFFYTAVHGQTKVLTGAKHVITIDVPKNWTPVVNRQLPLFLKPEVNVSATTYMYVYALDYNITPDMNKWIQEDINGFEGKHPGTQYETMLLNMPNLTDNGYQTGRYKILIYTYDDTRKQVVLVVESKSTITTLVLSTVDVDEYNKYMPSFIEAAKTVKVLARNAQIDKQ